MKADHLVGLENRPIPRFLAKLRCPIWNFLGTGGVHDLRQVLGQRLVQSKLARSHEHAVLQLLRLMAWMAVVADEQASPVSNLQQLRRPLADVDPVVEITVLLFSQRAEFAEATRKHSSVIR